MVSFNVYRSTSSGTYVEGVCLATDEKPIVGIANGSILFAVDASDGSTTRYMYDQPSMSWVEAECPCSGGGSGSGGSGGANIITCELSTSEEDMTLTATKTAGELMAADYVIFYINVDGAKVFANFLQGSVDINGQYDFYIEIDGRSVTLGAESADGYPSGSSDGGGGDDSGEGGGENH